MGFVYGGPDNPAAPITMSGRFAPRVVVERAGGNDELFAGAGLVRHWAIAALADLSSKASRFRQIEARNELFSRHPAKLIGNHRDIG